MLPTTARMVPPPLLKDHVPKVTSVQPVRTLILHFSNFLAPYFIIDIFSDKIYVQLILRTH